MQYNVILDLDGPVFDADGYLRFLKEGITKRNPTYPAQFDKLYDTYKNDISQLITQCAKEFSLPEKEIQNLFFESNITNFIRPGSRDFIKVIRESGGKCLIVTQGDPEFQNRKLQRLKLDVPSEALRDKTSCICQQIYGATNKLTCVIDDRKKQLEKIYEALLPFEIQKKPVYIHMQVGRHKDEPCRNPDFENHLKPAQNFPAIQTIIKESLFELSTELSTELSAELNTKPNTELTKKFHLLPNKEYR